MAIKKWNSGQADKPNVPMLAEWLEDNSPEPETAFQVVKISKSQQWGSYNLQCLTEGSNDFRVALYETKDDFALLEKNFKEWRKNNIPLFIVLEDTEWGHWSLGTDDNQSCQWTKKGSGFICEKAVEKTDASTNP